MIERLYPLLPAALRRDDAARGEPLRALMAILEAELVRIEEETETTWDDHFVETCEEWLVPYIGEALGVRGLRTLDVTGFSQRAYVANTLAYRRRKGTPGVLEQLARDVTGYGSRVVEYFARTATTIHMQHVRGTGTVDLRDIGALEALGSPFGTESHSAEVRRIASGRGLWNLPHVGLHLWRLSSAGIVRSEARVDPAIPEAYRLDPHGRDTPLFTEPRPEADITSLAGPEHVSRALSRRELADEERGILPPQWLGPDAIVRVRLVAAGGAETWFTTATDAVVDADSDTVPDAPLDLVDVLGDGTDLRPRLRIAHLDGIPWPTRRPAHPEICHFDPENGRLMFHPDAIAPPPEAVLVDFVSGSAAEIGAGVWDRTDVFDAHLAEADITVEAVTAQWGVSKTEADGAQIFAHLGDAIAAWNAHLAASLAPAEETGCIVVMDNRAHSREDNGGVPVDIDLVHGARLVIVAADWPVGLVDGLPARTIGTFSPARLRPAVLSEITVACPTSATATRSGGLWLLGLSVEDGVRVLPGDLETLSMCGCTVPAPGVAIQIDGTAASGNGGLSARVSRSVVGSIVANSPVTALAVDRSVVHAIDLPGGDVDIEGSTVLGTVDCRTLSASSSLFDAGIQVEHTQDGCVRFCYVPPGSQTPTRYRCQPDRALEGVDDPVRRDRIRSRVEPVFTTRDPAHPAYVQLAPRCPVEILRGAEDGGEMGVFFHLRGPWREDNLRAALRQYLRHGLEAGPRHEN